MSLLCLTEGAPRNEELQTHSFGTRAGGEQNSAVVSQTLHIQLLVLPPKPSIGGSVSLQAGGFFLPDNLQEEGEAEGTVLTLEVE